MPVQDIHWTAADGVPRAANSTGSILGKELLMPSGEGLKKKNLPKWGQQHTCKTVLDGAQIEGLVTLNSQPYINFKAH
jgi:hypothetical protein